MALAEWDDWQSGIVQYCSEQFGGWGILCNGLGLQGTRVWRPRCGWWLPWHHGWENVVATLCGYLRTVLTECGCPVLWVVESGCHSTVGNRMRLPWCSEEQSVVAMVAGWETGGHGSTACSLVPGRRGVVGGGCGPQKLIGLRSQG